jgi:hypothetical protein
MAGRPISRVAGLLLGLGALGAIPSPSMVEPVAQVHATVVAVHSGACGSFTCQDASSRECVEGFPRFLHSLTDQGLPIDSASQHMSSGFAGDVDWLRLFPISVTDMALNWIATVRASTMAVAIGALGSGCGGGAANDAQAATSGASSYSSTNAGTDSSATSGTTPTQDGATSASGGDTTTQAPGTTEASTGASTTTDGTTTGTDSSDPIVVAAASTTTGTSAPASSAAAAATTPSRSGAALNLSGLDYFAAELPTIDVMKRAGAWLTQCGGGTNCSGFAAGASSWDTLEESALDVDANGWIRSLPASSDTTHKYRSVASLLSAGGALPPGRYIVRYDGAGSISYSGATRSSSSAGRDVIDITGTGNVWMTITATSPGNYLRNIRVYMPGGACANDLTVFAASAAACTSATGAYVPFESFPATQIWSPQFLQDIKGFRALRFLDWGHTNTSPAKTWADRTSPTARTWTGPTGAPIEAMLDLANAIQADAWINLPTYVNDDYAAQLGKLAGAHLTGVSKLDLEYSNEPWNYAFGTSTWMLNQAKAKWPAQVAAGTSAYTLQDSWYGERASQVCAAAKAAYPATKCVVNGQAANSWIANQFLTCPFAAAELGRRCGSNIDILAIAPYFGGYVASSSLRPAVAKWYADADGGLSKLFQEITGLDASGKPVAAPLYAAGSNVPGGALAQIKGWVTANKAVADSFGIPLWAYEGGQHLVPASGDTDTSLIALFIAANRDARMGAAYDTMMANWQAAGGQTFAYYSHASAPSKYGMWGLKESMNDNSNAKWQAALRARGSNCVWSGC